MLNFISIFILLITAFISPAQAQDKTSRPRAYRPYEPQTGLSESFTAGPRYNAMATQLIDHKPDFFGYGNFRMVYAQTRQYDPLGEGAREKMLALAYKIETSKDRAVIQSALEEYRAHLKNHLAHIGVVIQALALSRTDPRFGDPAFFTGLRNGLLADVLNSGDGQTLYGAYDVINIDEEFLLLSALNIEIAGTDSRHSGIVYYNMHAVFDRKTGKPYTIFVDTTKPMAYLEQKRQEKGRAFSIRNQ